MTYFFPESVNILGAVVIKLWVTLQSRMAHSSKADRVPINRIFLVTWLSKDSTRFQHFKGCHSLEPDALPRSLKPLAKLVDADALMRIPQDL